jgi:uncharacterized membrane protein
VNSSVLLFALGIGVVAGLRTFTAPATVCWGAHLGWLRLAGTRLAFMGSRAALIIFSLAALGEFVSDQLPKIGKRTAAGPLTGRILFGALSGAALCVAYGRPALYGALLGGIGAVGGAFAGYHIRAALVRHLGVTDILIAIPEDLVAIGLGLLLVSRM